MASEQSTANITAKPAAVAAIAAFPGPVTGMTLATETFVRYLSSETSVEVFDLAKGVHSGHAWKLRKAYRSIGACAWLLFGRGRKIPTVYFAANAQWGLIYTVLLAFVCRFRSKRIVLHHHVCSYSSRYSLLMACVQNLMGPSDVNLMLGPEQSLGMTTLYSPTAVFYELPYGYMAAPTEERNVARENGQPLKIGHMCNLTISKGLLVVLQTFDRLMDLSVNAKLVLAGPTISKLEQTLVNEAVRKWPNHVEYLGPIYGDQKRKFFLSIDCFFFPTRYVNEAQPIVLVESMAFGLPVVTTDQGCIRSLVEATGSPTITLAEPLVERCVDYLKRLAEDNEYYTSISKKTVLASRSLYEKSMLAIRAIFGDLDAIAEKT